MGEEMNVADLAGYILFGWLGVIGFLAVLDEVVRSVLELAASLGWSKPRSEGQKPLKAHEPYRSAANQRPTPFRRKGPLAR